MKRSKFAAVTAFLASLVLTSFAAAQEFTYFGESGPEHWGELAPSFATCAEGARQSPVDFGRRSLAGPTSRTLPVRYGRTEGEIVNNGHTIEVETHGANSLTLGGETFQLIQFHFHMPSEHRFQGEGHDMELHLVHRSAGGRLAVVGVLLRRGPTSGALASIFENLPQNVDEHYSLPEEFDPTDFLPQRRSNERYVGSLTTPPCTEGVRWFVMTEPMPIADEHMARFAEAIRFNARPVQRVVD